MLVTLTRFVDPWEAHVVRARLEADGIPATIAHAGHAIVNWPMSLALGGTAVQVPAVSLTPARELLDDYASGALEEALDASLGMAREHCPGCGSSDFERTMPLRERLVALVIVVLFAPFPARRSLRICSACGHRWRWGAEAATRAWPEHAPLDPT